MPASRSSPPTSGRATGPHGAARRHLGGAEGRGAAGRHRQHPCRGQRHRHAHVRKADAREPRQLREHGRGAQHAVGGSLVQPGDPARRECRGRRALHGARLGGDRRGGDRGGARPGFPIYGETLHQYLLYNAEDYKRPSGQMFHTYPSLKYPEDQKGCGKRPTTARSRSSPPTRCAARCGSNCRAAASTTPPAAIPASSRACADVHRHGHQARLLPAISST